MAIDSEPARPTRSGYFGRWQRLFHGYAPLPILAALIVVMALIVPSRVQDVETATAGGPVGAGGTTGGGGGGGGGAGGPGTTTAGGGTTTPGAGTTGGGGGGGGSGQPVGGASGCADRTDQIPGDPYSPPCFDFAGDNGGATSKGVTATEIHVAYRVLNEQGFQQTLAALAGASLSDTPDDIRRTVSAYATYFNNNFQFFGRKLVIDFYDGRGSNTNELLGKGRDKAEADATQVADEIGAFADVSATSEPYGDALYRRGVVGFGMPYLSREWHTQRRPYAWSLATDCSIVAETVAEFVLNRLVGGTAKFAGSSSKYPLANTPRVITALAPENSWYQECVAAHNAILNKNGYEYTVTPLKYQLDLGTMSNQAANIIPQLASRGVTTVVCACDPIMPVFLSGVAAREGYFPEFINIGVALDDTDIVGQLWDQNFTRHSFGISPLTAESQQPAYRSIAYEAYKTVFPTDEPAFVAPIIYYQMYMLAIGVHMAGPALTPETFEQGMFSYPERIGPFGRWGFGPGDYTPQEDVREIYWDPNAISEYNGRKGAWIDPNPGQRYRQGEIPSGDPNIPVQT